MRGGAIVGWLTDFGSHLGTAFLVLTNSFFGVQRETAQNPEGLRRCFFCLYIQNIKLEGVNVTRLGTLYLPANQWVRGKCWSLGS